MIEAARMVIRAGAEIWISLNLILISSGFMSKVNESRAWFYERFTLFWLIFSRTQTLRYFMLSSFLNRNLTQIFAKLVFSFVKAGANLLVLFKVLESLLGFWKLYYWLLGFSDCDRAVRTIVCWSRTILNFWRSFLTDCDFIHLIKRWKVAISTWSKNILTH